MLNYTSSEGLNSSHFFINTIQENICVLEFMKPDIEKTYFNNDFLQNGVYDMSIVKVSSNSENCCKDLAPTIKSVFDYFLENKNNAIIRISVPDNSTKRHLIQRFIDEDNNNHFHPFVFKADGVTFFFFININKTSALQTALGLIKYFYDEYGVIYN